MTTRKPKRSAADPVRAAAFRAKVSAYFGQRTESVTSNQALNDLEPTYSELGLTRPGALYHLRAMAASGLLHAEQTAPRGQYHYGAPGSEQQTAEALDDLLVGPKRRKQSKAQASKDVELVLAGMLVVIGRNAATGRLRITLEEV